MLELAIEIMREIEARKGNLIGEVEMVEVRFPLTIRGDNWPRPFEVIAGNSARGFRSIMFFKFFDEKELQRRKEQLFSALSKEGGPSLSDFDLAW